MRALQFATAILASISLGLLLAALASRDWVIFGSSHIGLWQICNGNICQAYGAIFPVDLHAIRFFLMVGMLAGATSFLYLWAFTCNQSIGSVSMAKIAGITSLVAGFCALIAMSVFTGVNNSAFMRNYGWSFAVGWASAPLFLITGGLAFYMHKGREM
ncbi:lens fiber membrane intrinsic protein-like [Sphaerodactylus townsendi]|uniref:Uncharacterized protein n=1 Tax=Sphaerodactylus townsendi TaxID=933632 RepID=A0ACB8FSE1_9SAUR|nr:lens fiber membrane intrinsic protein-like [Sphaerodactylus townsendi]